MARYILLFRGLCKLRRGRWLAHDGFQGLALRFHPNVGVPREHNARDVLGDAHDHLVARARVVCSRLTLQTQGFWGDPQAKSRAGDQTIMYIAGHVSRQMHARYDRIRPEGKR